MPDEALFDAEVIHTLAGNLGNKALAYRFLSDYLDLLPRRKSRIIDALGDQDPEAAMDAILSLKITSAMVGAHDTEDRCRILQSLVIRGNLTTAALEAAALGSTIEALAADGRRFLTSHDQLRLGGG